MKKTSKILSIFLSLLMIISIIPMSSIEAEAATFEDINQSSVFVKQQTSNTCTLAAAVMMVRRAAILTGNSNWSSITESSMRSTAWKEGAGLWYSFSYAGIKVSHANLPGGSSNKSSLINLLNNHPEGIVLYNGGHAVLLTDYTNGEFYCADPANNVANGRISISKAYKVTVSNATDYWYVSSPKCEFSNTNLPSKPTITEVKTNNNGTVTVKWTACERTQAYTLRFYKANGDHFKTLMSVTSDTKYTYELPIGSYKVKVTAEGDGCWTDSEMSSEFTIAPETPEKPVITNVTSNNNGTVTINWSACERAYAYTLRFYKADGEHYETLMWATTAMQYTHTLPNGTYTVMVTAEGDGHWRDSDMSTKFSISVERDSRIKASVSDTAYGESPSTYVVGNTYYFYYEIYDANTGANYNSYTDNNYRVTSSLYGPSGSTIFSGYSDQQDKGYFTKKLEEPGTYKFVVTVTGDATAEVTDTIEVISATYKVSYNANGGTNAPSSQTKTHGTALTLSSTVPTRTGYTFLGWSTSKTATTATYQPGDSITVDSDITLYAVWQKDPVTVSSISIATKPTKTEYYVGEEFNTNGLALKAVMSDGSTEIITSWFSYTRPDMSTPGTKTVTIRYEGKEASFTITVNEKPVTPDKDFTFSIQEPSRIEIRNKDGIVLHTVVEGELPDGARIEWSWDNNKFDIEKNDDGTLTIIARNNGETTITATVYGADGDILATDSVVMNSKSGFFDKIGGFFRSLFGTTTIYEN